MAVEKYDGWWVDLNNLFLTTDVRVLPPGKYQKYNMNKVYDHHPLELAQTHVH